MSVDVAGRSRRWVASAVGALLVMAVALALVAIPRKPAATPVGSVKPKAPVEFAGPGGIDKTLNDERMMRDQTPLFLPTERNVSLPPPRRPEAGRTVLDQDASRFSFVESDLKLNLPPPEQVPEKLADAVLADPAATPLHGFGRATVEMMPLPARGGFIEILDTHANRRVLAQPLAVEAKPPTEKPWRPLEFLAAVDAAGLVGSLVITQRSDVEEVNNYFRNYLVQTFRVGERLPPGFYRIVVGP